MKPRTIGLVVATTLLVILFAGPTMLVDADEHVETVVSLDPSAGELPEGIATDAQGNVYFTLAPYGQVVKRAPDGSQSTLATLDSNIEDANGALGLTVDPQGNVYAALVSFNPETHGVWRIAPDGATERLPGTQNIFFSNSLALDPQGTLYVTTSTGPSAGAGFEQGGIWRIPPDGEAELWLRHDFLTGLGRDDIPAPVPLGANGLAYHNRSLYVANTEKRNVIRVPVEADGSAGGPETVFQFDRQWDVLDGIAVDDNGDIYVLVIGQSELVRISADRNSVTTIASGVDGLDLPASLAFGQGQNSGNLFLTNYAFLPADAPIRPRTSCETLCPGIVRVSLSPPTLPETGSPGSGPVVFALIGTAVVVVGFAVRRRLTARGRDRSKYVA